MAAFFADEERVGWAKLHIAILVALQRGGGGVLAFCGDGERETKLGIREARVGDLLSSGGFKIWSTAAA